PEEVAALAVTRPSGQGVVRKLAAAASHACPRLHGRILRRVRGLQSFVWVEKRALIVADRCRSAPAYVEVPAVAKLPEHPEGLMRRFIELYGEGHQFGVVRHAPGGGP